MKRDARAILPLLCLPALLLADHQPDAPAGIGVVRHAFAIVGAPLTPVSVAGAARRTTRRVVAVEATAATAAAAAGAQQQQAVAQQQAATAKQQQAVAQQQQAVAQQQAAVAQQQAGASPPIGAIVSALPAGCVSAPEGGVEYYKCGNVRYRPAFQGNNLVYVVQ